MNLNKKLFSPFSLFPLTLTFSPFFSPPSSRSPLPLPSFVLSPLYYSLTIPDVFFCAQSKKTQTSKLNQISSFWHPAHVQLSHVPSPILPKMWWEEKIEKSSKSKINTTTRSKGKRKGYTSKYWQISKVFWCAVTSALKSKLNSLPWYLYKIRYFQIKV